MPTAMKKAFRLFDLALDRVDLVRAGSNPKADIVLFKSAESQEDNVPQAKKKTAAKKPAAKKPDVRSKSKQRGDEEDEDEEDDLITKGEDDDEDEIEKSEDEDDDEIVEDDDTEDEDEPVVKGSKKPAKKAPTKKPTKKIAASAQDDDEDEDDDSDDSEVEEIDARVLKTLPASVQRSIERSNRIARAAQKQAREAAETAEFERSRRESLEAIEKAKADIPHLPGTDEEKGEVFASLEKGTVGKKVAARIIKMLKAGSAALAGMLMAESGRSREDVDDEDTSVNAEVVRRAKALQKKDPDLSFVKAKYDVLRADPDLWKRNRSAQN